MIQAIVIKKELVLFAMMDGEVILQDGELVAIMGALRNGCTQSKFLDTQKEDTP